MLALGVYPDVTLAEARSKREEAKRGIAVGIAPNVAKREERRETSPMPSLPNQPTENLCREIRRC